MYLNKDLIIAKSKIIYSCKYALVYMLNEF